MCWKSSALNEVSIRRADRTMVADVVDKSHNPFLNAFEVMD